LEAKIAAVAEERRREKARSKRREKARLSRIAKIEEERLREKEERRQEKERAKRREKARLRREERRKLAEKTRPMIDQIYGMRRKEKIRKISAEDKERIKEAEFMVRDLIMKGEGPSDLSALGIQYYELIAAIEKMSPHDIYTLFMSPT
jgi:hypothetical protein